MEDNANTDVDKLITFGQMALEQGWYDKAREYFQQALELNPASFEAKKGLHQIDRMLECRRASFEPVEIYPMEPIGKKVRRWITSVAVWICDKFRRSQEWITKSVQRFRERREERAREYAELREKLAKQEQERTEKRAKEIERLKQAWAEKRMQRGGVPLQLGQCPECGSIDANKYKDISPGGCLVLMLFFPIGLLIYLLLPSAYRCRVCGAKWKG